MLCAQIHPFKSELQAAHFAPLAINEWLYCNEDILRKRARIGQDSELQYALQCYPRFKNLSFGCKSLELCADVAPDVGIKAKSRLLRFL